MMLAFPPNTSLTQIFIAIELNVTSIYSEISPNKNISRNTTFFTEPTDHVDEKISRIDNRVSKLVTLRLNNQVSSFCIDIFSIKLFFSYPCLQRQKDQL